MSTGTTNLGIYVRANTAQARAALVEFQRDIRTLFRQLNERGRTSVGGVPLSQITAQLQQLQTQTVQGQQAIASEVERTTQAYQRNESQLRSMRRWERASAEEIKKGISAQNTLLQSANKNVTKGGGFGWLTGQVSDKGVKESAAFFADAHKQAGEQLMASYIASPASQAAAAQYAYRQKNEVAYLKLKTEWLEKIKVLEARGQKDITVGTKSIGSFATGMHGPDIETSAAKMKFAKDTGLLAEIQRMEGASNVLIHKQSTLKEMMATTANMMKSQISWFAGAGAIFAVVGGVTAAAKATLEFYQNLKNIQAVTGESDAGIRKISAAALEVAKNTPIAASEASKLGLTLIQAGLNSEQAAEAMKTVAAVTTVSGEDMVTVSKAVTTAMFSWHKSAKDIPDIGNSIAAALNFSRLTVTDLGTAFNYLASTSSIMGRSLNETVSIMATLSNAGIRASTIGTGMSQLFTQLLVPSRNFSAELARMGISANAVNPMNKFADIVELLQSKGFSAAKAMHLLGDRAGREMAAAMVMGADAFRKMERDIEKSKQLQDGLAKAMEGPINSMKNLRNQIEVSAIQIGAVGVPAFNLMISLVKTLGQAAVLTTSGFSALAAIDPFGGIGVAGVMALGAGVAYVYYQMSLVAAVLPVIQGELVATATAATAAGTATTFFSSALTILGRHPYMIAATATIGALAAIGLMFGKNKDQVNGLATAYDASKAADEAKKRRISEQAEEVKHLETTYTHLKEVWEEAGKKFATLPFQMENVGILGMYSAKVNDLAASIKKLDEVLQNIDKNGAGVGWFTRIIGGYQQVLDIQKKGVEGERASRAAELLKAQKEEMEALAKANAEILSLSTGKYIDSVIAGIKASKKATIDEQIAEAKGRWADELQRIKNDISVIQYSVATTKSEPEKEKLRGQNKEKIQEMARTNESFKRLIQELGIAEGKEVTKLSDHAKMQEEAEKALRERHKEMLALYEKEARAKMEILFLDKQIDEQGKAIIEYAIENAKIWEAFAEAQREAMAIGPASPEAMAYLEKLKEVYLLQDKLAWGKATTPGGEKAKKEESPINTVFADAWSMPFGMEKVATQYETLKALNKSYNETLIADNEKAAKIRGQIADQEAHKRLQLAQVTIGAFGSIFGSMYQLEQQNAQRDGKITADEEKRMKKWFYMMQHARAAETVVNTASAAMKAWSQLGAFGGPAAALIIAAGAAQLAVIESQKFEGGGGAGGAGSGGSSASGGGYSSYFEYESKNFGSGWKPGEGQGPGTVYPYRQTNQTPQQSVTVYQVNGDVYAQDSDSFQKKVVGAWTQDYKDNGDTRRVARQY